jgi:DNA (cytosine-5)-methyltransferase 1
MPSPKNAAMSRKLNALSLFSGAGGLDLGFHNTGAVQTLACYEFNELFSETLRLNRHKLSADPTMSLPAIHQEDLSKSETISRMASLYEGVDIVFGGPPCQSFSIMGKKGGTSDPRGALIFSFSKIISSLRPRCFLFENVPNFASIDAGMPARELHKELCEIGYSTWCGILCAADYGAYTFRRRFFILGVLGNTQVAPPVPTHLASHQSTLPTLDISPWKKCGDVFDSIESWLSRGKPLLNHEEVRHSKEVVERFSGLKFGETDNVRKRNRLDPGKPAHSIYVGGVTGKLQARPHIHPFYPRELTARECVAIQGFPLDWQFMGRADAVMLQAANAVPVQLAEALARHLVALLHKQKQRPKAYAAHELRAPPPSDHGVK